MKKNLSKKKSSSDLSQRGFDDIKSKPIKIKSIKKTRGKGLIIQLGSINEKEKDSIYTCVRTEGKYQVLRNGNPVLTPSGKDVTTTSEILARAVVAQMNELGEQYEDATTIISFLYSEIDFFRDRDRASLAADILNDLHQIDWTLRNPYYGSKNSTIWARNFGISETRTEEIVKWIETLNKHKTEGVYVMTANISSPNIAFILSNKININELPDFTKFCEEKYTLHQKKEGQGMYYFWPYEQMLKIFNNYLLWQEINN